MPLLNAMAHVIVAEGLIDRTFIDSRVSGFEAFAALRRRRGRQSGRRTFAESRPTLSGGRTALRLETPAMIVNGLGATEHVQGTEGVSALINLALLTGNIGGPGVGINALRARTTCRVPRTWDASRHSAGIDTAREAATVRKLWGAPIPREPG